MTKSFPVLVLLQLCAPALLYLLVGVFNGRTTGIQYLLPNYLFMAAPHLLVAILAIWPRARRAALLWVLAGLNALLVAFQLWVLFAVPVRESGLAWVLYIPLWGLALSVCAVAWVVVKLRGPNSQRVARSWRATR
jgi:hypothetical protein